MLNVVRVAVILILLLTIPTLAHRGTASAAPDEAVEYEVYYHHTLRNKTERPLLDIRVYIPVPLDDACQQISEFRIERDGPVHITNRSDRYGTKMKRLTIARLEPGASARVGFSCVVKLKPPVKNALDSSKSASLADIPAEIREKYTDDQPIAGGFKYKPGDGWDQAPVVLERRSGSCSEFTYVFCGLCRATGIPTRMIGGSIFPLKSKPPFRDKGWHRWAEAYLPGHGWVAFDPTLDRAAKPKQDFVGNHHPRVLVLTRIGSRNTQLGLSYIGANSHTGETARSREFVWSQGTLKRLAEANALIQQGQTEAGRAALRKLMNDSPGTRAAEEAARLLNAPATQPSVAPDAEEKPADPSPDEDEPNDDPEP